MFSCLEFCFFYSFLDLEFKRNPPKKPAFLYLISKYHIAQKLIEYLLYSIYILFNIIQKTFYLQSNP